jgi:hypothetical protein
VIIKEHECLLISWIYYNLKQDPLLFLYIFKKAYYEDDKTKGAKDLITSNQELSASCCLAK